MCVGNRFDLHKVCECARTCLSISIGSGWEGKLKRTFGTDRFLCVFLFFFWAHMYCLSYIYICKVGLLNEGFYIYMYLYIHVSVERDVLYFFDEYLESTYVS